MSESHNPLAPLVLNENEIAELKQALNKLESGRGVLVRLADLMGGALGQAANLGVRGLGMAPGLQVKLQGLANSAVKRAFDIAILGINRSPLGGEAVDQTYQKPRWRDPAVQAMVAVSGAVGGFTGLSGLIPDIGFTTLTLMREVARIAQEEGEDLTQEDAKRACLEVFALRSFGNAGRQDEESELGFFSSRVMLRGRPMIMLMAEISSQYGLGLSQKIALQMMPVVGALCGASLNAAFLAHYRSLARVHFMARRLERQHGPLAKQTAETIREQVLKSSLGT